MASNLKVDIVRPTATNGTLALKGDSGGSATTNGIIVNSSGNTAITGTTTVSSLVATTADINGGTIDGADINGGTIDNATIGGTTPAAGSFTQVNAGDGSAATPSITNIGDTNTGIYFPAADTVGVSTGGTERMRIDSSGKVGIGTNAGASSELELKGSSNPEFRFSSTDSTDPYIYLGDETDIVKVGIGLDSSENALVFKGYNNSERMRIDSSGNVELKATNAKLILPSGGGIDFSAYGVGTNINSNLLDDYEEGTWSSSGANGNWSGEYVKIGNTVSYWGSYTATSTGDISDGVLPFQNNSGQSAYGCGFTSNMIVTDFIVPRNSAGGTQLRVFTSDSGGVLSANNVSDSVSIQINVKLS